MTTEINDMAKAGVTLLSILQHLISTGQINDIMSNTNTTIRGPRAGSFNAQVQELAIGENVSKVRMIDPTIEVQRLPAELPIVRQQLRNSVAPAVTRAKEATGGNYSVEVGDCVMPSGQFYVVAVITRTA